VVSAPQGSHLLLGVSLTILYALVQILELFEQVYDGRDGLDALVIAIESDRDRCFDLATESMEALWQILSGQISLDCGHTATNIYAHSRRGQSILHSNNGTYRSTLAKVNVGHNRNVLKNPRKVSDITKLV
jgi:hypothetical protein